MNEPSTPNPLALLIHLQQRLRQSVSLAETRYILVNETHLLVPYRQAVLWNETGRVMAMSGVTEPQRDAPFIQWLEKIFPLLNQDSTPEGTSWNAARLPDSLQSGWAEWLPEHGWLVVLRPGSNRDRCGLMLLTRPGEDDWTEMERIFLAHLAETGAMVMVCQQVPVSWKRGLSVRKRARPLLLLLILAGILMVPVKLSVLAPAEMVAMDPAVVRAPMDGVVDQFQVRPNETVAPGQPIFNLDDTTLRGKLEVALKTLETVEAEYRQTAQQAILDVKSKTQMAILAGRIEERRQEVDYLRDLLARIQIKSPRAGVAIFNDPYDWIGRPVVTGERVMTIAMEDETEVEAWLAVGDLITLASAAPVTLFLNIDPLHPVSGRLRHLAYEAVQRPDGAYAYRLRASVDPGRDSPRVGLKGTLRIDGSRVSLAYWLMRRPLAVMRQWLGI
ncbi:MAG: HlyD family efflux transporter periplasmic adaptor subunit [Magnetococcales bacterium]|nr:HlyD family efflux transporter periplasmic adaptor subunit [Magnetococcales bacterium]